MRFERVREFFLWFYRYRSLRLTPEGVRFLLLTLAVGVAALNTGNNLLYLLLAMMLSLIVMSGILSEQCLRHLVIRRRMPDHVFANSPALVMLSLANRKLRLPSFSLRVLDVVEGKTMDRGIHVLHLPAGALVTQSRRAFPSGSSLRRRTNPCDPIWWCTRNCGRCRRASSRTSPRWGMTKPFPGGGKGSACTTSGNTSRVMIRA